MKIKKVLVEVNKEFSPARYNNIGDLYCYFRVNIFYGSGRYFFFYSGLFKKRRLKKNTWLFELILNRDKYKDNGEKYIAKPLRILKDVIREEGRYEYERLYVSPYLMRRLLERSTNPESFKDLETCEN